MGMQFDEQSIRRIVQTVLRSERQDHSRQVRGKRPRQYPPGEAASGRIAKTRAEGVPGRDDTNPTNPVPGKETVDFYKLDDSTPQKLITDGEGEVFNLAEEAVAANTWIQAKPVVGGGLFVDWEEC